MEAAYKQGGISPLSHILNSPLPELVNTHCAPYSTTLTPTLDPPHIESLLIHVYTLVLGSTLFEETISSPIHHSRKKPVGKISISKDEAIEK